MIAEETEREIDRLLALGKYSRREIARRTAVSHSTVARIANGTRQPRPHPEERLAEILARRDEGPPRRCPDCGGMVFMPCLLCDARLYRERSVRHAPGAEPRRDDACRQSDPRRPRDARLHDDFRGRGESRR
ncbi:MAG: XRE family transcriptional regulator [Planctomycetota bacterium]|nr:MAG: XRE family transcriptional regulator [Planctomycetota bacterium]REJ90072.1 MAG: XRE family transcriptional regulator [Planctomycetota bacterium]REK23152.1 MAG: XRE family transcriptional regulator [Planctomycetota bacterium]REK43427.1 MAG: XRE family transcriptional regulator [Planctomycetota bacterium]